MRTRYQFNYDETRTCDREYYNQCDQMMELIVAQKVATAGSTLKVTFVKETPKFAKMFCLFSKNGHMELYKIAQSSHTDYNVTLFLTGSSWWSVC